MLKNFVKSSLTALALTCIAVSAQAPTDLRVALVIGNAAYAGNAALANPTNDAKAMAETLRGLGFTVVEIRDGGRSQMLEAIAKVQATLKGKQAVGMLYYAGHGLQLDWRNYMVPVDAKLTSAADVAAQTVDVNAVIDAFKGAGNRMNILVLDACRDNPFRGNTAAGKGLAQVDAPPGTFLAYATAPGNVAEDGDEKSGNGLYTQYLLQELKKPTAKIEDVFKRVRLNVRKQSEGRQIPWESTSLEDDFFFNDGKVQAVAKLSDSAKESAFNAEKADWDKIKESLDANDLFAFLTKYPNGFIAEQAQFKLERLQKAKTQRVANKDGVKPLDATAPRFQKGDEFVTDVIDGFSKNRRRTVATVVDADSNKAVFNNGGEWDQSGSVLKSNFGIHSPGILHSPADMAIGKKWKTAYQTIQPNGGVETAFWEFHVVGYETITVPAGTFKAFIVKGKGQAQGRNTFTAMERTAWFDPATFYRLRDDRIFRVNGKIENWTITEAVSFKKG